MPDYSYSAQNISRRLAELGEDTETTAATTAAGREVLAAHGLGLTQLAGIVGEMCEQRHLEAVEHAKAHGGMPCPYVVAASYLRGEPDPRADVAIWRITVPFAAGKPPLTLNDRHHPMAHAGIVNKIKALTRTAVREADVPELGHVHVEMHYRPAVNRIRDVDNLVATLKPMIDALHQPDERSRWEPIVPGDDPRYVSWSPPVLHPAVKGMPASTWLLLRSTLPAQS